MKLKIAFAAAAATFASTTSAFAVTCVNGINMATGTTQGCATDVPEISALEGTAALAALAAIVFIAWERRSRAA